MLFVYISLISLSVVAGLCILGVFHEHFRKNPFLVTGLALLSIGCIARLEGIAERGTVSNDAWLIHVGLALLAIGASASHYRQTRSKSDKDDK